VLATACREDNARIARARIRRSGPRGVNRIKGISGRALWRKSRQPHRKPHGKWVLAFEVVDGRSRSNASLIVFRANRKTSLSAV